MLMIIDKKARFCPLIQVDKKGAPNPEELKSYELFYNNK